MKEQIPLPIVPPLMTKADLARFLGVSDRTVRRWVRAGALELRRVGPKDWVVMRSVLTAGLAEAVFEVSDE